MKLKQSLNPYILYSMGMRAGETVKAGVLAN